MGHRIHLILILLLTTTVYICHGCQMEGVIQWPVPVSVTIYDTHRGVVLNRSTSDIEGINSINMGDGLNAGPYLETSYSNSQFLMWTNDAFERYEENEVEESMSMTVNFRCTGGTTRTLVFWISVIDTNNNAPQFLPSDALEFTITTPVPPRFLVTGCFNDITVRDIDLTTQRIDFGIEENPYFEIEYDASLSSTPKEFKAVLRTTTLIRTLPEPIVLRISATDVDLTGDPPITTYGTVRVSSDTEFQFPEEPIFSQIFYLAEYNNDHTLVHEQISLRQGYDEQVRFSLEGDYLENFQLITNGNNLLITVRTPLNATTLMEQHILLIVTAEREYTSGGATTVVIQLPEVTSLEFESPHYNGSIVNNNLQLSNLILSQGYQDSVSVTILSEYTSYFNAVVQGNIITVTMIPLSENIILENNFIHLQVLASTDRSSDTTIVTLEVIKDDNDTPVLNRGIYTGNYDSVVGLTVEPIYFVQGFDQYVSVSVSGDHSQYFQIIQDGPNVIISSSVLPPEMYSEHHLLLSIEATKPRTVGANAAVVIYLPAARVLDFEAPNYKGTLQDNILTIETILLSVGYDDNVNFNLTGDYASFFTVSNIQNRVTLNLLTSLPDGIISENNLLLFTLNAFGLNAITTSTNIVLEIIKEDATTPLFNQNIYFGDYIGSNNIRIENINLRQGYDEGVSFRIEGEHSHYFRISNTGNSVILSLQSEIPHDVIFNEKVLAFNILAEKAFTVGANAAVLIRFPVELTDSTVMRFARNTYVGTLQDEQLTVESIVLNEGYDSNTEFVITGEYVQYFAITRINNIITIIMMNTLPISIVEDNNFIVLEIEARRERAVSVSASVVIDIIKEDVVHPVFSKAYYRGVYANETGLQFEDEIYLISGHDDTVTYRLEGEFATLFSLEQNGSIFSLRLNNAIPQNIMDENNQLLFTVVADKPNAISGRSAISIELLREETDIVILSFAQNSYVGKLEDSVLQLPPITLLDNSHQADLTIVGEFASHFVLSQENNIIRISLIQNLTPEIIEENPFIVLNLIATYVNAVSGHTTIVIEIAKELELKIPVFSQPHYIGEYSEETGLIFNNIIQLSQGYGDGVTIALAGDDAQWFTLVESEPNNYRLIVRDGGITVQNRNHLIFSVVASTQESINIHAAVIISLTEYTDGMSLLRFERITYTGSIRNDVATLEPIILSGGYTTAVSFSMVGDLAQHFILTSVGPTVTIALRGAIPEESIPDNRIIVLEVQASAPQAVPAHTSVVFTVTADDDATPIVELVFAQTYYTGSYSEANGLTFGTPMSLSQGYNESVEFALVGDQAQWFGLVRNQNSVTLTLTSVIPAAVISNNNQLIFVVTAQREGGTDARATIVIELTDEEYTEGMSLLGFERITYTGSIRNDVATLEPIILSGGYTTAVSFSMFGDLAQHFILTSVGPTVTIALRGAIPEESIPDNRIIVLEVQASAPQAVPAHTSVVFTVTADDDATPIVELVFAQTYYTGSYSEVNGLTFGTPMSLSQGYDETVEFALVGDQAQWFGLVRNENSVTLTLTSVIPADIISNNDHLIFIVTAQRNIDAVAQTIVVISLIDTQVESDVRFENVLYEGGIQNNIVRHESIVVLGFTGANIELYGEYANMFTSSLNDGMVSIQMSASVNLPDDIVHIVLEMHAATARAVLLLNVVSSDAPIVPSVTFSSSSYSLHVDVTQTGLVGHVHATADNGESVRYSIQSDSAHLLERISINNAGELHLSAPVNSGVYTFQVVATTVFTQATATATVQLTVQSVTICGDDIVVPPLIVLDRDEEEPHNNLVVLNTTQYPNCQYVLTNRWPTDQSWLYVDENGLHARAIDREHESIAFMALSQVQVELNLQCDSDRTRSKRSTSNRPEWLGPYDYGTSNWILSDSITYNSRRSFVNLIVNDINDNAPVFVGKENEPIAVGYPILEIEERVMPRSLAELQATDADVGINAALLYWSSATELAVAPSTGFVHVRDGAQLEQDARFTVHATDRNGEGLTGSIELIVKLLDINNILVVTVSDAFLDDEQNILTELSKAVGYDVKVLRSTVTSQSFQSDETRNSRKIRETGATGASLQLYIYGIIERVPVSVDRLAADVNNNVIIAVSIVSTVSLEDHLEGQEICVIPGRDTGLLVATIILSIILFILIVLIIVWFILSRRKKENYEQFSDQNSLASRNESLGQLPKPDNLSKPRLNIEDLKKSERRLQEMLDAPLEEVIPHSSRAEGPFESILDIPTTEPHAPIVIQSIDKLKDATDESEDDEFGETNKARRKSVVTFNENVEKIIHVEDNDEPSIHPGYEGTSTQ